MKIKEFLFSSFFLSLSLGVIIWFSVFIIFPIEAIFPVSSKVIAYILISYLSLIFGYLAVPKVKDLKPSSETIVNASMIKGLIVVVLVSFLLRYFDLFVLRGVRFFAPIVENRMLLETNPPRSIFILASVGRYLFFAPILLLFHSKIKSKKLLFFCVLLFLLPFIEGIIRGSRNSFFYPSILLVLSLFYFKKIQFKKSHIGIILLACSLLFVIATSILKKREMIKEEDYKSLTSTSIYNKFLKPKQAFLKKLHSVENIRTKQLLISGLQTGQYYTHGVFEFDYLLKTYRNNESLNFQYGKYNFSNYIKLSKKVGETKLDLAKRQYANPRGFSFITFFGGLYIDFGWVGLVFMFLFGAFQKFLQNQVKRQRIEFLPLLIFFLFINFFMLTFNFLRGNGVSIMTVNLILILVIYFKNNRTLKKRLIH